MRIVLTDFSHTEHVVDASDIITCNVQSQYMNVAVYERKEAGYGMNDPVISGVKFYKSIIKLEYIP